MSGELHSVIECDRLFCVIGHAGKKTGDLIGDRGGCFIRLAGGHEEAGFPLNQNEIVLSWLTERHQITLPMAEFRPASNGLRAVMDGNPVSDRWRASFPGAAAACGFALGQIPMQLFFASLSAVNETVDGLMTDRSFTMILLKSVCDLFRRSSHCNQLVSDGRQKLA